MYFSILYFIYIIIACMYSCNSMVHRWTSIMYRCVLNWLSFFFKGATSIEQYCLRRDTWRQVAVMSGRRLQFGVAVLDDRLYVVGGRDGLKTLNTVECYNPRSKSWSVMPPMSTHRHGLGEEWYYVFHLVISLKCI